MQFERWAAFLEQRKQAREAKHQKEKRNAKGNEHGQQKRIRQEKQ